MSCPATLPSAVRPSAKVTVDLVAAHVVRVGQHPALAEHDARADAPPLPDADHRGAGALRQLPDACLDLVEDRHRRHSSSS